MDVEFILIRRMKRGDKYSFDIFVNKYYEAILKYCTYHCPNQQCAEDLTQETFIKFFSELSDYDCKGKTKNYLYTIARNLCKDYYKKIKEVPIENMKPYENIAQEEYESENTINNMIIQWALNQLPYELREVIILYYFHDLKLKEIAIILKISLPLVKYRVKQAKLQLEKLLRKEDI
ncbi:RNA polymerase sigma factor [Romboutsia sedimentorum]|uniref:RNA polymerase sigma factor n=1 Tax=Romboutsia sedimentorum TaxID=1368474 RepID=UPI0024DEAE2A|nr:RNA polymerase sigma factor [Romboutsia sedimentorum]MDK2587339.1 RNA polymerase sigma factor [Romboutsia sedimentorum]